LEYARRQLNAEERATLAQDAVRTGELESVGGDVSDILAACEDSAKVQGGLGQSTFQKECSGRQFGRQEFRTLACCDLFLLP
jgi:hypothetical protein